MLRSVLRMLFNEFAKPETLLMKGVLWRDLPMVQEAFKRGVSPNMGVNMPVPGGDQWTPPVLEPIIVTAIQNSSLEIVEEILKRKPNPMFRRGSDMGGGMMYAEFSQSISSCAQMHANAGKDPEAAQKLAAWERYCPPKKP